MHGHTRLTRSGLPRHDMDGVLGCVKSRDSPHAFQVEDAVYTVHLPLALGEWLDEQSTVRTEQIPPIRDNAKSHTTIRVW